MNKCKVCGTDIDDARKTCSRSCANRSRILGIPKQTCEFCGNKFHRPKCHVDLNLKPFCNKKCEAKFRKLDRRIKECEQCGKEFEVIKSLRNKKYCSRRCFGDFRKERGRNI